MLNLIGMELCQRNNDIKKYLHPAHFNQKRIYSKGSGSFDRKSDARSEFFIFAWRIDSGRMPLMQWGFDGVNN